MKRGYWVVLGAFLGGIVLANLLGKELLTTYGIFNEYFLSQYSYRRIDGNRLFCHVFIERCRAAFIIFLLGRVVDGRIFSILVKGMVSATFGFLVVVAIINLGMRGLVVTICGLLPQWIFYLAALFFYAQARQQEGRGYAGGGRVGDITLAVARGILLILGMLLGIVAESYINPVLLGYVLKIF